MPGSEVQFVLADAGLYSRDQILHGDRFVKKAKNMALINGVSGGFLIGVAGQHHANGVRCPFVHALQDFDAIHPRHPHIAKNH